jgi:cytochrome c peroxidase
MKKYNIVFFFCLSAILFSCDPKETPIPVNDANDLTKIPYSPQPFSVTIPDTWQKNQFLIPADNPLTISGIALGRALFYDPILSQDSTKSCNSCHLQDAGFTDNSALSTGVGNRLGERSSMSLVNVGFHQKGLFWDGRTKTLEAQALQPIEDGNELRETWPQVIAKLKRHKTYPTMFREAFGIASKTEITKELAAKAIAQFERTIVSKNSKFDQFVRNETDFTDDELYGYYLFFNNDPEGKVPDAQCGHCHAPSDQFTDNTYRNNGLDEVNNLADFKDKGLGRTTGKLTDNGKFRTPTLRNIALTAPYMHDGRIATLEQVIEHYASGGKYSENADPLIREVGTKGPNGQYFPLTTKQKKQLLAFLNTLTDNDFVKNSAYKSPF